TVVPKDEKERAAFKKGWHLSPRPGVVKVIKRPLRVLLFAGGPGKDYQFVRRLFVNEGKEGRLEMCVLLQTGREQGVDQDVPQERLLDRFPFKIGPDDPNIKFSSLSNFDVIIAIDPDWPKVESENPGCLALLERWVTGLSGGLILVAGPVYTYF